MRLEEIQHLDRLRTRMERKTVKTDGCWLWTGNRGPTGYGTIGVTINGRNFTAVRVHRIAYVLAYGSLPDGLVVCHHCDNPSCVRPDHLYAGTMADNVRDRDRRGRRADTRGGLSPNTHFTVSIVRDIRRLRASGATYPELAGAYGVTKQCIWRIVHRQSWQHVD